MSVHSQLIFGKIHFDLFTRLKSFFIGQHPVLLILSFLGTILYILFDSHRKSHVVVVTSFLTGDVVLTNKWYLINISCMNMLAHFMSHLSMTYKCTDLATISQNLLK